MSTLCEAGSCGLFVERTAKKITDETGEFLIMPYSRYTALGFRGDLEFVKRCQNWAENMGITQTDMPRGRKFHWAYNGKECLGYVLTDGADQIIRCLQLQIYMDILASHEIVPISERFDEEAESWLVEYDETAIDVETKRRAEEFYANRVKLENFIDKMKDFDETVFGLARVNRGGKWCEFGG